MTKKEIILLAISGIRTFQSYVDATGGRYTLGQLKAYWDHYLEIPARRIQRIPDKYLTTLPNGGYLILVKTALKNMHRHIHAPGILRKRGMMNAWISYVIGPTNRIKENM